MISGSNGILDLGRLKKKCFRDLKYPALQRKCAAAHKPPMAPFAFADTLKGTVFTNGADRIFVAKKYTTTFLEVFGNVQKLDFGELQWGDVDIVALSEALAYSRCLTELSLKSNSIADVSPLARWLGGNTTLKYLDLSLNSISDITSLWEVLRTNKILSVLQLGGNPLGEEQQHLLADIPAASSAPPKVKSTLSRSSVQNQNDMANVYAD